MTRSHPSPFLATTLVLLGIVVGMAWDRTTIPSAAQPPAPGAAPFASSAAPRGPSADASSDDHPSSPPLAAPVVKSAPAASDPAAIKPRNASNANAKTNANTANPSPASTLPPPPTIGTLDSRDAAYEQLAKQYSFFEQVNRTFELVAKTVGPSVVHIEAIKSSARSDNKIVASQETGSGVIVRHPDKSGLYVLTNHHVVEGVTPSAIRITLWDGRVLRPAVCWSDKKADVAVIPLDRGDLPAARLGDSDSTPVGTWVMALGSPFGLRHSVSQGIISARGRHEDELQIEGVFNQDFLQTDAAINPGNSGGPLVNLKGEVIGINTAIATNHGGSEGVGFSIPINLAEWVMDQLVRKGRVTRGGIGVDLKDVAAEAIKMIGLPRPQGALIASVRPNSPAEQAGIRSSDVVLRFNGIEVQNLNHLINLVAMAPLGRSADVILWRNNAELPLRVTVIDRDRLNIQDESPRDTDDAMSPKPTPSPSPAPSPSPTAPHRSPDGYAKRSAPPSHSNPNSAAAKPPGSPSANPRPDGVGGGSPRRNP